MSIDLLVPGVDEELMQLHMASDKFENTTLFLPKPDFVETMSSKLNMVLALAQKELQCQKLYWQMLAICLASTSHL